MEKNQGLVPDALNHLSSVILDSAIVVHKEMGPGLLEGVYHHCMVKELRSRQLNVDMMVPISLHYKGEPLNKDYVIDILVEEEIILELKAMKECSLSMKRRLSAISSLPTNALDF